MLGPEADTVQAGGGPVERLRLADACLAVRQRLEAIASALGALREEIDRTLAEGRAGKEAGPRIEEQGRHPSG